MARAEKQTVGSQCKGAPACVKLIASTCKLKYPELCRYIVQMSSLDIRFRGFYIAMGSILRDPYGKAHKIPKTHVWQHTIKAVLIKLMPDLALVSCALVPFFIQNSPKGPAGTLSVPRLFGVSRSTQQVDEVSAAGRRGVPSLAERCHPSAVCQLLSLGFACIAALYYHACTYTRGQSDTSFSQLGFKVIRYHGQTRFPFVLQGMGRAASPPQACAIANDAGARQQEPGSCGSNLVEPETECAIAEASYRGYGRMWQNSEAHTTDQGSASEVLRGGKCADGGGC